MDPANCRSRDERLRVSSLILAIRVISFLITLAVLADIIVSFFLHPYHPIRQTLDSIVEPMLAPIRQILPTFGGLDFSPMVLIILIQILEELLISLLVSVA